jgi:hypothetical protein
MNDESLYCSTLLSFPVDVLLDAAEVAFAQSTTVDCDDDFVFDLDCSGFLDVGSALVFDFEVDLLSSRDLPDPEFSLASWSQSLDLDRRLDCVLLRSLSRNELRRPSEDLSKLSLRLRSLEPEREYRS